MKQDLLNYNPFTAELRKMGFTRDWIQRRTQNNPGVVQYSKMVTPQRKVEVQLWGDSRHRATNMMFRAKDRNRGRASTQPTTFCTVQQMLSAIARETTRRDHRKDPEIRPSELQRATSRYWAAQGEIKRTFAVFKNLLNRYGYSHTAANTAALEATLLEYARNEYETAKQKLRSREGLTTAPQ